MKKRISFFTISMLLGSITYAGVAVNPVQLYIRDTAKQKSTTLTVESIDETEKKIFEIKALSWTQDESGKNILSPDDSVMINPKSFILNPYKQQTIRIGFSRPVACIVVSGQEKAWRIILEEMPQVVKDNSVNFLFNFNLPLFVGKQDDLKLIFKHSGSQLKVINEANSHVQITNLKIVDTAKKEIFKSNEMNYLLAKKSYSYDLGNTRLNSAQKYAVQVNTDKDDKVVEFQISD